MEERSKQLADAYEAVARINHYMVGIVEQVTLDELEAAKQILIIRQSALLGHRTAAYRRLDLALDLIVFHAGTLRRA